MFYRLRQDPQHEQDYGSLPVPPFFLFLRRLARTPASFHHSIQNKAANFFVYRIQPIFDILRRKIYHTILTAWWIKVWMKYQSIQATFDVLRRKILSGKQFDNHNMFVTSNSMINQSINKKYQSIEPIVFWESTSRIRNLIKARNSIITSESLMNQSK